MIQIKVNNVSFAYTAATPVLTDVSLEFGPGATAVIGQNGAGKTTLMKLLNGLLKPDSGTVQVDGRDISETNTADTAKSVGLVFQNPDAQIFKPRVKDEVEFGPLNIGTTPAEAEDLAVLALNKVGLADAREANPYDLSYADRKKVCVASILAMDTPAVVFDEPTLSQDAAGLQLMGQIVSELKDAGKTVIAIVHDMNFAAEYFDDVVVMAEGKVLRRGPVDEVFQDNETLRKAHVEAPAMGKLSQALGMERFSVTLSGFIENFKREQGDIPTQ